MQLRRQRRIRKQLRRLHLKDLRIAVNQLECRGLGLEAALRVIVLDPASVRAIRSTAVQLLTDPKSEPVVGQLLDLFFRQADATQLWETALILEQLDDRRAVPPLIRALLEDRNPDRRRAAARALGWIRKPGRHAARALAQCLLDRTQPVPVREEAAESLAYVGTQETVAPLIAVLRDPDVAVRFWAVFALGRRREAGVVVALESMLDDHEAPPGNWWSVSKEALAMLGSMQHLGSAYVERLGSEIARVLADPNATAEDRNWAGFYQH